MPLDLAGEPFEIAENEFSFVPKRTPHAFNAQWRCGHCGCIRIFRNPPERTDEDALTVAKMTAYYHLRTKHPELIRIFFER